MPDPELRLMETMDDANEFFSWLGQRRTWLGIDTETGGLDYYRDRLRTVQFGDATVGWTIPWEGWGGVAKQAIEAYTGLIAMHNTKFDLHFLEHNGVDFPRHNLHDTMPMVGLLEPAKLKGLKPSAQRHVFPGVQYAQQEFTRAKSKGKWTFDTMPIEHPAYWAYASLDPVVTSMLAEKLYPYLGPANLLRAYDTEVALAQVLTDMESRGMLVDLDYSEQMSAWLWAQEEPLLVAIKAATGVDNPHSDAQMIKWFQKQGHIFLKLTDKDNIAFDSLVLDEIMETGNWYGLVAEQLKVVRDVHKERVTYFDAFLSFADEHGRLHTQINPMEAITARMSSERPNLQNIPARVHGKRVRDAFLAAVGYDLIAADYDQIEYRILVVRAGEQRLIDAINAGQDLHAYMAAVVYNIPIESVQPAQRALMKNATFAFLYGAGDEKFARMAGITVQQAKGFRQLYAQQFPAINTYARTMIKAAQRDGGATTPYLGRRQVLKDRKRQYKLLNYVTQGEAGDVLKAKMVELSMTDVGPYMSLPIHDELLFETPQEFSQEAKQIILEVMPENNAFDVPLSVGADIMTRWGDKYE